jgi:hypothetical protein
VVATFAIVAVTVGVLVYDAVIAPWTVTRQNLSALAGDDRCGLADQLTGAEGIAERMADADTPTLVVPALAMFFPCARTPSVADGIVEVPTFVVHRSDPWPLAERDGPFAGISELYETTSVAVAPRDVVVLEVSKVVASYEQADAFPPGP